MAPSLNDEQTKGNNTTQLTPLEAISHGGPTLSGPPKFPSFAEQRTHQLAHLAGTFRHWARQGYVFGFSGHISYRDPEYPDAFWTNPLGVHFGLLKASDMILVNLSGEVIGGNRSRPANTAGFLIHAAVHKARPDVHAVCHCHSPAGKAWSTFNRRLDMITQDACKFFRDAHAVYDSYGGVVLAAEEGDRIASALGPKGKGCILRNHGLLTVGQTVDEAAWLFDALEHACRDQLAVEAAMAGGAVKKVIIEDEEAEYNFSMEADPAYCYAEFQVYYEYEKYMSKEDFTA
ncbi:aldolase [Aspergillus clavatus NRRL 1]|uniref:Aldolase n=1 Tax=Aspergillus clavatus (strain ATCC 1007 / CBS 513.65 / DSM 816 / NCTC 3887 / NRRL 1 / QM 1276 / 107) TaxID=344612 RepID=A1CCW2_ASPCL|nr:aldolase [Aspergillus clavatus NRRL 1]EAW12369.1 aldolase [Aspergillus clavatus NRRL 1]